MKFNQPGQTNLTISQIGLGTMTWGEQNTQADGFEQMDYALNRGINFFDTVEVNCAIQLIKKNTVGLRRETQIMPVSSYYRRLNL